MKKTFYLCRDTMRRICYIVCISILVTLTVSGQKRITGTVTDAGGEPVIGANVVEKGTTNGITTDAEGKFVLTIGNNNLLLISYIGYVSQELDISRFDISKPILVQLLEDIRTLEDVVVVGYGSIRRNDVTGSVVSVGEHTLQTTPAANFSQALIGRAAGVDVAQSSGYAPGSVATIRIRGNRSISASNDPLYVIDGMTFTGGTLNDINVADIASIEILKDASATAIYGSRAANG
ncbi:MAG: TonB-dependent receptor plug domain-containing protein, partial [Tannerella sp.]|nr:TonB-dependent receptor plug domain-containing protein [Tannerella sp.]